MNTKPELLNKPLIEQIKGFDYTTISKCSRISSDDIKCSAYFSLIKAIKDELGEQEAVRFLENTLFPKLANVNLEEINPQHLSGLLNEFLTNEGLSVFKVNYTKSTNEILIKQPPIYCASVISEGRVIGTASHFLVSKAFQYAKIQAISTTINRYYIENIEL
ncbi:hypothetical protein RF11_11462 [Thelohanellus kitauei]|uniref:Uncharacterized protein n=1 Tax=Thelohanellus kitauei TaxID=669202 RepID=A0A0C2N2E1_THEKT|nr:hypothetical protein RF11_11462 [Thelohanellus kitauei]